MTVEATPMRYEIAGTGYEGALLREGGAQRPWILMAPDWLGVSPGALIMAERFFGWGYDVLVADLYGSGIRPASMEDAEKASAPLKADRSMVRARMTAILAAGEGVFGAGCHGAVGFCFGGMNVLELARAGAGPRLTVSIHGDLDTDLPAIGGRLSGEILVLHGAADPVAPKAQRDLFEREMETIGARWSMVCYGGTVHSFTDPSADLAGLAQYSEFAATRALAALRMALGGFD